MKTIQNNQKDAIKEAVGLVGLGLMGRGMGLSLLRARHELTVLAHRRRDVVEELTALGAREAVTAGGLAAMCRVVVLCLPSVDATESVLFGPGGIAETAAPGFLIIECSTLMPANAQDFRSRLAGRGIGFVDAPVTRGPAEALAGRLNALVGGETGEVERAAQVLAAFCERVFRFGVSGNGYAAKLVNNFLAFTHLVVISEAMAMARGAGLDMTLLLDAIGCSGGQSRSLASLGPWLIDGSPTLSIVTLATAFKDVDYYRRFAKSLSPHGATADHVFDQLAEAMQSGLGDRLTPEYVRHVAARAGVLLPANQTQKPAIVAIKEMFP